MAKFVEINDGIYVNPDRVSWVQPDPDDPDGPTQIWFSGNEDDFIRVDGHVTTVAATLSDEFRSLSGQVLRR